MSWRDSITIPFTRIEVVSRVPALPGVYAVMDGETCLMVGDAWNLRARLLGLANALTAHDSHSIFITFEACENDLLSSRKLELEQHLLAEAPPTLPGLRLSVHPDRQRA
jgi:hypothetical protein